MKKELWFYLELSLTCPKNEEVKGLAVQAGSAKMQWSISKGRHVPIATTVLRETQPTRLTITLRHEEVPEAEMRELLTVVSEKFQGQLSLDLWKSLEEYKDCSYEIQPLSTSK